MIIMMRKINIKSKNSQKDDQEQDYKEGGQDYEEGDEDQDHDNDL